MAKAWWIDPSWDPLQDLENCKKSVNEHAKNIGELINQSNDLVEIVQQERLEIALLTAEVLRLRKKIENLE